MVWAILVVCVAALALIVMRSRRPEDEPAPIVAVPKQPPKPVAPILRTKASTTPPPVAPTPTPTPTPTPAPAPAVSRTPSSIPLEDPLGELELGKAGATPTPEPEPRGKYHTAEQVFDPKTPDIPLAEEPRAKTPSAAPPMMARTKSATIPPVVRNKAPSIPPEPARAKAPSLATEPARMVSSSTPDPARMKGPSVTPPLGADEVSIPVAPESGLHIRAKRPSSAPPIAAEPTRKGTPARGVVVRKPPTLPPDPNRKGTPAHGLSVRSKTPGAVQQITPLEVPVAVIPEGLANKLRYTTLNANISHVGISASREDGFSRVVMWPDVVGIVARRLPADAPYDGATFVDLVSTAGATLRILPWTVLTGDAVNGEGAERARSFCQLVAARCRGAKLDSATRTFIGSHGQAAQLPDEDTLAAHDKRLA